MRDSKYVQDLRARKFKPITGARINDCFKPSLGASVADLREFHAENMKLRRRAQRARTSTWHFTPILPADINHRTDRPHLHLREKARFARKAANANV